MQIVSTIRPSLADIHPVTKADRPGTSCSPNMSPAKEAAGERRQVVPQDDDVTRGYPDRDDVDCDVIDARRRHASTSLDTSLTTEVMDDDDVDDDNEDQDTDGKKRKKTRTVFSRHQVITAPVLPSCSK